MEPINYYTPKFKVGDIIVINDLGYNFKTYTPGDLRGSTFALLYKVVEVEDNQYELLSFYLSSVHGKECLLRLPTMQVDINFLLFKGDIESLKVLYF